MQHHFDIEIAKEYGINEAILLNNIQYWITCNKANNINYYDGTYWTYNSTKAFNEIFPYLTQRQIQNALKKLRDLGILKVGNYNKLAYDRTLWYAFTEKGECIMQKCKMEDVKKGNGLGENVEPIPDINSSNKTSYVNTDKIDNNQQVDKECLSREEEILEKEFERLWKLYPRKEGKSKAFKSYCKFRKSTKDDYVTSEEVEEGIEAYIRHIKANNIDPKYIKQGATWFGNRCWEDEYPEVEKADVPEWFYKDIDEEPATTEEVDEITKLINRHCPDLHNENFM